MHRFGYLAKRFERGANLFAEDARLFPGSEVPALVDLVEVHDVRVGLVDPAARGPPQLTWERGEADRDRDRRRGRAGRGRDSGSSELSQYDRAAEAPVPVSQYSVMLSSTWSRVRLPTGCSPTNAREIL